jgi:hypothetical protein
MISKSKESSMTSRQKMASLLLTVAMGAPVGAQQQPRTIQRIAFYRLKPDRVSDFVAAVKEYAEVEKKAGVKHDYTTWASLTGDREFARVDLYSKFAEMDTSFDAGAPGGADRARLGAKIDDCTESTRTVITGIDPELVIGGAGYPPMIVVDWVRVQLGKGPEYHALAKSDLLPMMKKAGVKFFFVAQTAFGGPPQEMEVVSGIPNWAAIDGGSPVHSLGEEAYQRYRAKAAALIASRHQEVYRFRADRGYSPAPASSTQR